MKPVEPFSINGRLKSAQYALAGIVELLANQHNAWLHAAATTAVIALGLFLSLATWEWCCLILAMTLVWVAEALNTALELLCDAASPDFHPLIKKSKDVAAGAVLISAVGAAAVGLCIFVPHLVPLLAARGISH